MFPRFCCRFNSQTKKGPPSIAVMTPTGISTGAMRVRLTESHKMRKLAPKNMEHGINKRKSGPTTRRTICGTINPTNPMGPLMATTVPVIREARMNPVY